MVPELKTYRIKERFEDNSVAEYIGKNELSYSVEAITERARKGGNLNALMVYTVELPPQDASFLFLSFPNLEIKEVSTKV